MHATGRLLSCIADGDAHRSLISACTAHSKIKTESICASDANLSPLKTSQALRETIPLHSQHFPQRRIKQRAVLRYAGKALISTIRNIISASHGNHLLRFLNENGAKLYNVTVTDVKDTGEAISGAAIIFGTVDPYLMKNPHAQGDFKNITVRNVISHAQRALDICEPCENLLIENVVADAGTEMAIRIRENFHAENVTIRDLVFTPSEAADSFSDTFCPQENLRGLRIENVRAENIDYLYRGLALSVNGLTADDPRKAIVTSEHASLASAYGRYFRTAYGKVITNRPKDNRFQENAKSKQ